MTYTYEDIAAKIEWEGGLDEALDWFEPEEVPAAIRVEWDVARALKRQFNEALDLIWSHFPEELQ